ncbi:hypothetical protein BOX15_Mlig007431g1, partial [Macrostomum lignano]
LPPGQFPSFLFQFLSNSKQAGTKGIKDYKEILFNCFNLQAKMSLVNPGLLQLASMKDSRWLTLEVCREFQRSKCSRTEIDCKFAHPPKHVDVQNGRVVCCYDYIKGKCQRKEPPCKYLHPPQHLREQLLQNGRNNLIIKSIHMQMLSQTLAAGGTQLLPLTAPFVSSSLSAQAAVAAAAAASAQGFGGSSFGLPQHLFSPADAALLSAAPPPPPPPPPPPQPANPPSTSIQSQLTAGLPSAACAGSSFKLDCSDRDCLPTSGFPGGKRAAVADAKSGIPVYQPGAAASYQQQLTAAAFQLPPNQQGPATGAFIPTSWTGDLFQEASCPTLTWV